MSFEKILEFFAWKVLWNPFLPMLFLGLGLYITVGMRFFQFRRFGTILQNTFGTLIHKKSAQHGGTGDTSKMVTSFEAFATALGGTVGSGNIAGVASALALGGPGALFWMWIAAFVGMATKMGEIVLAQHYRTIYPDGSTYGGAAYYIEKGMVQERGMKWAKILAVVFSISMIGSFFFGVGTYTVAETVQKAFNFNNNQSIVVCIVYTVLLYVVILGGIPRIVRFACLVVPFMCLLYVGGGLVVLLANLGALAQAFVDIFHYAFTPHAAVGGFAGVTVMKGFQMGVARSVYSNEAGWGSSPMIHASANVDHPARQGMWGAFEVFMDTIVVCSITGLSVLVTGVWQTGRGGAGSVGEAFATVFGQSGLFFIAFCLFLFQITTSTGWYSYLESILSWIASKKTVEQRARFIQFVRIVGPLCPLAIGIYAYKINMVPAILWILMDIQTAIPIYLNVVALVVLSPVIFRLTREFEQKFLDKKPGELLSTDRPIHSK